MEGLCKDCAYWYRFSPSQTIGTCDKVEYLENIDKNERADNAFVFVVSTPDDQGLDYSLQTGPMFGCVAFKNKKG